MIRCRGFAESSSSSTAYSKTACRTARLRLTVLALAALPSRRSASASSARRTVFVSRRSVRPSEAPSNQRMARAMAGERQAACPLAGVRTSAAPFEASRCRAGRDAPSPAPEVSYGSSPSVPLGVQLPRNGDRLTYTRRRACASVASLLLRSGSTAYGMRGRGERARPHEPPGLDRASQGRKPYRGSRVKAGTCTGRTAAKWRTSSVNTSVTFRRSATATTEASTAPRGKSA